MRMRVVLALLSGMALIAVVGFAQDQSQDKDKGGVDVTVKTKDTDAGLVIKSQATAKEVGFLPDHETCARLLDFFLLQQTMAAVHDALAQSEGRLAAVLEATVRLVRRGE